MQGMLLSAMRMSATNGMHKSVSCCKLSQKLSFLMISLICLAVSRSSRCDSCCSCWLACRCGCDSVSIVASASRREGVLRRTGRTGPCCGCASSDCPCCCCCCCCCCCSCRSCLCCPAPLCSQKKAPSQDLCEYKNPLNSSAKLVASAISY